MKRFRDAKSKAIKQLDELYNKTKIVSEESAEVFEVHKMLIEDIDFVEGVEALIYKGKNAEFAVDNTAMKFKLLFDSLDNELMKERALDILDIRNRLVRILKGIEENNKTPKEKFILLCDELLPSDIVKFNKELVVGIVTKSGSLTSHASILARTLGIPCVVNVNRYEEIPHFGVIALNGKTGEVIINPDKEKVNYYQQQIIYEKNLKKELENYRGKKAITKGGKEIKIGANIGNSHEIELVLENDADCVGLFRSEFIYLESNNLPSEDKQFTIYKNLLSKLSPKNVIIRTLDIGADKTVDYLNLEKEENPALGYRAIRICLNEPEIFKTQLRALYRASVYGNLSIMFPMITHIEQIEEIKVIINEVKAELDKEQIPYSKNIPLGIMIETPAAVMLSEELAKMVDFFSIGTNDLTQYTLACDRMNNKVSMLFDQGHESVLRMIAFTAKNAHKAGIWVGICGESAGDLSLLDFYIEHDIDELSVAPNKILRMKKEIIER